MAKKKKEDSELDKLYKKVEKERKKDLKEPINFTEEDIIKIRKKDKQTTKEMKLYLKKSFTKKCISIFPKVSGILFLAFLWFIFTMDAPPAPVWVFLISLICSIILGISLSIQLVIYKNWGYKSKIELEEAAEEELDLDKIYTKQKKEKQARKKEHKEDLELDELSDKEVKEILKDI